MSTTVLPFDIRDRRRRTNAGNPSSLQFGSPTGRIGGAVNRWSFDRSVERFCSHLPDSGAGIFDCWRFTPSNRRAGYAVYGSRTVFPELYAHRIAAGAAYGDIPEGMEVDHLCYTTNCVNPFHLRICTLEQNREWRRERIVKARCPQGHPYAGDNLYVNPRTGRRYCRECMRIANRAAHHKYKDARNAERAQRRKVSA